MGLWCSYLLLVSLARGGGGGAERVRLPSLGKSRVGIVYYARGREGLGYYH